MVVSLDTLIIVGAFVVAAIYLVAQAVAGVNRTPARGATNRRRRTP
jgi:hypothetical protein